MSPILKNPSFQPSLVDGAFYLWASLGIRSFSDLYIQNTLASFEQLSLKFGLPKSHFFRYLQIRSFVKEKSSQFPSRPPCHDFDNLLSPPPSSQGLISCLYGRICSFGNSSTSAIKMAWEQDLGCVIQDVF